MTATLSPSTCAIPLADTERVQLGHGSGGKLSSQLLSRIFLPHFSHPVLTRLADAAVLTVPGNDLAVSTDTFVVHPLEFAGGDIGMLAVHGTINDVAMMGAEPLYLTAGFVLEEGLPLATLERIVSSMARAAQAAGVALVAGDTKVVERGKADGVYINTTGIGTMHSRFRPGPDRALPGDAVIVSAPIARHGMAIMAARESVGFEAEFASDTADLYPLVRALGDRLEERVHVLRDPTRGGAASTLNEIAAASKVGIELDESSIPVPPDVLAACEMLGLDPLYVANEGVLVAIVPDQVATLALDCLREQDLGREACVIGRVVRQHPGMVVMKTALGGTRVVDMLPGDQLPRIC